MDEETVYLHHTFHHGGSKSAANNDLQKIRKAMDENNLETVDYWTKNYPIIFHLIFYILFSGQILPIKKPILGRIIETN